MFSREDKDLLIKVSAAGCVVGLLAFAGFRYKVGLPNQRLVKTGLGVQGLSIHQSTVHWPFQRVVPINVQPWTVAVQVNGMSSERIPFKLPLIVTVGPKTDDDSAMRLFAEKLSQQQGSVEHEREVHELVRHIVGGTARLYAANMGADELFHERNKFRTLLSDGVEEPLKTLGLCVLNMNLEELGDEPGGQTPYFEEQRKRSLSDVHAEARVFVATAETKGEVGSKKQESDRRIQTAELEKQARLLENDRKLEVSRSDAALAIAKAELDKQSSIAAAEGKAAVDRQTLILNAEVEREHAKQEAERLRAQELAIKVVDAEKLLRETKGQTDAAEMLAENAAKIKRMEADAHFYAQKQQALGIAELGEADAKARRAMLIAEADGISAKLLAEAQGLERLVSAAGGPSEYLAQTVIKDGTLPQIAEAQAAAVREMKPVVWHHSGASGNGAADGVITSLAKDLPPFFDMMKQTAGIDLMALVKTQIERAQKSGASQ
jgi:flotillin